MTTIIKIEQAGNNAVRTRRQLYTYNEKSIIMLMRKKMTEASPTFTPPVNYLGLDAKLIKQFQKLSNALNSLDDFKLPRAVAEFARYLVLSTEPRELIHFACLHNQRALYSTLREFIRLHIDKANTPENVKAQFLDIASQFLTQAYCICLESINMWHLDDRWSYYLALDLGRVFKPFRVPRDQQEQASSQATEVLLYEE